MYFRKCVCLLLLVTSLVPLYSAYSLTEVNTASDRELIYIARMLGIHDTDDPRKLRELIIARTEAEAVKAEPIQALRFDILSAQSVRSLEHHDQRMIIITGDVEIRITAEDEESYVKAGTVILDQHTRHLFAFTDAEADLGPLPIAQKIASEALVFSLEDSGGAVLSGTARFDQDSSAAYYLSGEFISITGEQEVTISRGVLSTREEDPYFSIHAGELSLMPGGDISIRNAWFYLGRVPVFYLPYLYYPTRTFVFHPVVGIDSSRGFFTQSTYYFLGSHSVADEEESGIFQFFLDQAAREALDHPDPFSFTYKPSDDPDRKASPDDVFKIMTDTYGGTEGSPPEVFVGLDYRARTLGRFSNVVIAGGLSLGEKRHAFTGDSLPLERFGAYADVRLRYSAGSTRFGLQLPYTTQREFSSDFHSRFDQFSLSHLYGDDPEWPRVSSLPSSLLWKIDMSTSFRRPSGSLVEQISISELSASLSWRLEETDGIRHFTPRTITAPNLSYRVRGTVFSYQGSSAPPVSQQTERVSAGAYGQQIPDPFARETHTVNRPEDAPKLLSDRSISASAPQARTPERLNLSYLWDHNVSLAIPASEDEDISSSRFSTRLTHTLTGRYQLFDNMLDISSILRTRVNWFDRPFGDRESADLSASTVSQLHDLTVRLPSLKLTYRMDIETYYERFLYEDEDDRRRRTFSWDKEQFRAHSLTYQDTWKFQEQLSLESRTVVQLPPLDESLRQRFKLDAGRSTYQAEGGVIRKDDTWDPLPLNLSYRFSLGGSQFFSHAHVQDLEDWSWTGTTRLQVSLFGITLSDTFKSSSDAPYAGENILSASWRDVTVRLTTDHRDDDTYGLTTLQAKYDLTLMDAAFWKNRIRVTADAAADLLINTQNELYNNLTLTARLSFRIEEFLSISFSSSSYNRTPQRYIGNVPLLFSDIIDSFRFDDIQARRASPFKISAYTVSAVHYMPDWDLHLDVEGKVRLVDGNWDLVHAVHVYLSWKHIPELTFDRRSEW